MVLVSGGLGLACRAMIASLHLHRVHGLGIAKSVAHMALDRRSLAVVDGLRFWKLLGTGSSETFALRDADPTVWGFFGVWESNEAQARFAESSRVAKAWAKRSDQQWSATLQPLRSKGQWARRDPFDGLEFHDAPAPHADGSTSSMGAISSHGANSSRGPTSSTRLVGAPIAVLTRARVKPSQWRSFARAIPPVATAMQSAEGLRFSLGIGEAPIGLQATFSVWESAEAIAAFAYKGEAHRSVIQRTATAGWYAEELFSRYSMLSEHGQISGVTS
jgi:heme-degrading monooxygenase HmoA